MRSGWTNWTWLFYSTAGEPSRSIDDEIVSVAVRGQVCAREAASGASVVSGGLVEETGQYANRAAGSIRRSLAMIRRSRSEKRFGLY